MLCCTGSGRRTTSGTSATSPTFGLQPPVRDHVDTSAGADTNAGIHPAGRRSAVIAQPPTLPRGGRPTPGGPRPSPRL